MKKLLIGGSPCTHWSIAKQRGRETEASGLGWELFMNYVKAKELFQPDFFLYENNKSASPAIKEQIHRMLGGNLTYINSSLVSAQNRERFYVTNTDIPQPEDRRILLRDVLLPQREREYRLDVLMNPHTSDGCIRIGTIENSAARKELDSQQYRVYSPEGKSVTLCGNGGGVGAKTGLYFTPLSEKEMDYELRTAKSGKTHLGYRHHHDSMDDKAKCLVSNLCRGVPYNVLADHRVELYGNMPIYSVRNGMMEFKGELHKVPLRDGNYVIRKLLPVECERLQTLPDGYTQGVSDTQRYKCLGNGWTAEVIIHILRHLLQGVSRDERLVVLSMYDGIATGRYCLERLGFTNVEYHAFEIDPYAIKIAMNNYPDIIQHGDAFSVCDVLRVQELGKDN